MLRVAVIIASKGRPDDLALWQAHMQRQSLAPSVVIWAVPSLADLPADVAAAVAADRATGGGSVKAQQAGESDAPLVILSPPGLTRQRNAGLSILPPDADVVAFFDDDYVPSCDCLAQIAAIFERFVDVAGVTGRVLADGIKSVGISVDEALALVGAYDALPPPETIELRECIGLYGCNMAFRVSALEGERFDENLPLYGWHEDVDFAMRVSARGRLVHTNAFAGVHRGAKGGRVSGLKFGYSQVANIVYLCRKGSVPWHFGLRLMARNLLANHGRMLWPEPWVDRRGRAYGNWLAIGDLLRGRVDPLRVAEL